MDNCFASALRRDHADAAKVLARSGGKRLLAPHFGLPSGVNTLKSRAETARRRRQSQSGSGRNE